MNIIIWPYMVNCTTHFTICQFAALASIVDITSKIYKRYSAHVYPIIIEIQILYRIISIIYFSEKRHLFLQL